MSDANVERLRALIEPWDGKNLRSWVSAWRSGEMDLSLLDPSVVYEDTVLPDQVGESYRGHEGVARAMDRWNEPYGELIVELERIVGKGDVLVSVHRVKSRGDYSGIQFDSPVAYLWRFREGSVILFRSYWDPKEALAAAGLGE
jgi:ketosteroid isomerase-like protein